MVLEDALMELMENIGSDTGEYIAVR